MAWPKRTIAKRYETKIDDDDDDDEEETKNGDPFHFILLMYITRFAYYLVHKIRDHK